MAERLLRYQRPLAEKLGGLDPDVVEAAGLAHDLGHPPFGHIAEQVLQKECDNQTYALPDSFEGNAQTFRIINTLAIRDGYCTGLNLTRATCNAILKYPWERKPTDEIKKRKWGVYEPEKDVFEWARSPLSDHLKIDFTDRQTLEAEVMDFADDIAYCIYDMEDFAKSGKIPLGALFEGRGRRLSAEANSFLAKLEVEKKMKESQFKTDPYERALLSLGKAIPDFSGRYLGTGKQRALYRNFTSFLVGRFMNSAKIQRFSLAGGKSFLDIPSSIRSEVNLLKALTFTYVIYDPSLVNQQSGYKEIISTLFRHFQESVESNNFRGLPPWCQEALEAHVEDGGYAKNRVVVDFIASLTEAQAVHLYQRIKGVSSGSIFASIV